MLLLNLLIVIASFIPLGEPRSLRKDVYYNETFLMPFCKSPFHESPDSDNATRASFTFDHLWQLQTLFWDSFISPANDEEAKSINSRLLAPNVLGRVDVTRTFGGQELNTEYLFGLFATLIASNGSLSLLGYPIAYEIVHFVAAGNIASASTIVEFNFPAIGMTLPVEIDTWNMWNSRCQVIQYDATFKWFQYLVDTLMGVVAKQLQAKDQEQVTEYLKDGLANSICDTHEKSCTGNNSQYADKAACYKFLTTKIRFGEAYELGRDTLLCRMVHQNMVPLRPEVHCPHIGPSGGGMCADDSDYKAKVNQKYFTNAPWVPFGYA